ncbi:carbonic anhydrase [Limimonas halophila]|uniref:Carbonic anhydrase n=1 Tax=Limimonas halophila TaxID=1082479 RepID=A0A1G7L973_9PROT|nr:carbonic anhydrase [Limimonas halophila]SDF46048.1 carbonic anhydrase [Limimonas halophila]
MSAIDDALANNATYAQRFDQGGLTAPPRKQLAVLTCMDARLTVSEMLGLETGDAHVIRNAGAVATEDALRSLLISHHKLGVREIMVIGHTDCGMTTFDDGAFRADLEKQTGCVPVAPAAFHAFPDVETSVRRQVKAIVQHPWVPDALRVAGFVYDVHDGRVRAVDG